MFEIYNNTALDIAIAIVAFLAVIGLGIIIRTLLVRHVVRRSRKTDTKIDDTLVVVIRSFGSKFYAILAFLIAFRFFITTPSVVENALGHVLVIFLGVAVVIILFRLIDFFGKEYVESVGGTRRAFTTALPAISMLLKIVSALFVFTFVLSNLGVNITALVAGLGIGGIAIAFAFQKILADLFSSFVIFFDKPFSEGDSIEIGSISGTVERVGIKTTHVRAFSGEKIVVPNEQLVGTELRNITDRTQRKVVHTIPVAYKTTPEKLQSIPKLIEDVVSSHNKVLFGHAKILEFGEHAVMFEAVYKVEGATFDEFVDTRHTVHLGILEKLHDEKIDLGYPVKTAVSRGTGS